ncbi:hypothetical protein ACIQU5_08835 [Streptomyces sp. NPDC090306]|uniref:hypothetical protein n=1 Tax=unclassified Streptomyces TaxID=2593676 RepID=UPI0036E5C879
MTTSRPGRQPGQEHGKTPEDAYIGHVGSCRVCQRETGRCGRAERLWREYQDWRNTAR